MDILAVRKKAQAARDAAAAAPPPPGSSAPPASGPPAPAATTTPEASALPAPGPTVSTPTSTVPTSTVPTSTVPTSTVPTTTVPTSTVPTTTVPTTTVPTTTVPTSTVPTSAPSTPPTVTAPKRRESSLPTLAVDPLLGFLAVDDVDDDGADEGGHEDVVVQGQRFLAFRIGAEEYAATIMDIKEILPVRSVTEVPRAPRDVLGVVSRRGVVLPLVDLGASLGLREADRTVRPQQRVLVAGDGDRTCGLRVDAVSEVVRLLPAAIEPVPASLGQRNAGLLLGLGRVGSRLFILLDVPAVLGALAASVGLPTQPRTERLP